MNSNPETIAKRQAAGTATFGRGARYKVHAKSVDDYLTRRLYRP